MNDTENLLSDEALNKLKELVNDIKTCMLITDLNNIPLNMRPMHTLEADNNGNLWFFSAKDSKQNTDIQKDPRVHLAYAHPGKTEFLSIYGEATIFDDKERIDELWTLVLNTWFEGKSDPNITVLRITVEDAYYWNTKHNKIVSLLKLAASAVSDYSASDDDVKGNLNL